MNGLMQADLEVLVGLDISAARVEASRRGMVVRVVAGTPGLRWWLPFGALHRDLRPRRPSVQTRRCIVRAVLSLG